MHCTQVQCNCPRTECANYKKCCDCVTKHRESDSLPFCYFPNAPDNDKSMEKFYKHLKERFENV